MKFDIIIPMGMYCASAQALRAVKKRSRSLPFDWIIPLSFEKAVSFIENDFKDFFNKEDLIRFREDNKKHIGYKNKKTGLVFLHDFTIEDQFDTEYELIKEKYDRRIQRLYQTIKASKNILYIHIYDHKSDLKQTKEEAFIALEKLQKRYPDKNQHLCFIDLIKKDTNKAFEQQKINDCIDYYECYADNSVVRQEGQPSYVYFQSHIEDILRLYTVKTSLKDRFKKFVYKVADGLAGILPSKHLKERLRMFYKEYK